MANGQPARVAFGVKAAAQIVETVRQVRNDPRFGGGNGREPRLWNPGVARAIVDGDISACSDDTPPEPGSGTAQIWRRNVDGDMEEQETVTVTNWSKTFGPTNGKHIIIGWVDGEWELVSGDC